MKNPNDETHDKEAERERCAWLGLDREVTRMRIEDGDDDLPPYILPRPEKQ
jgi:hypothetical protein